MKFSELKALLSERYRTIKGQFLAYGWNGSNREIRKLAAREVRQDLLKK